MFKRIGGSEGLGLGLKGVNVCSLPYCLAAQSGQVRTKSACDAKER